MMPCVFNGSYYDPTPWTEEACIIETSVPAGCPLHFVTGAMPSLSSVTVDLVASDGTMTQVASAATLVGTVSPSYVLPDELSCDCAPTPTTIPFERFAVAVPGAAAGETLEVQFPGYSGPPDEVEVGPAAACGTPQWPTDIQVALACDRCPPPPGDAPRDEAGVGTAPDPVHRGCDAGSGSVLGVVGIALLSVRRRRARARLAR